MAELTDLETKYTLILNPVGYEQKDEHWFSANVNILQSTESIIKGNAPFHINDL